MTILTDKEKEQGLKELREIKGGLAVGEIGDVQYFRDKLIQGLQKGQSAKSLEKTFKQIALFEDAVLIYHKHLADHE